MLGVFICIGTLSEKCNLVQYVLLVKATELLVIVADFS